MVQAPLLAFLNFDNTFVVESDTFSVGIEVMLSQKGHLIDFFSKALSPKHQALSVYEKEMLAILTVVKK